jgi:hypothetical protein
VGVLGQVCWREQELTGLGWARVHIFLGVMPRRSASSERTAGFAVQVAHRAALHRRWRDGDWNLGRILALHQ